MIDPSIAETLREIDATLTRIEERQDRIEAQVELLLRISEMRAIPVAKPPAKT